MMKIQCLNSLFFIFISQNWLINFRNLYTLIRWFLLIWFILEIDLYFKLIAYQRMQYKIYILCFFVSYFFYCTLHRLIYKHVGIQENFVWRMCIMQSTWYILFIHMAYYYVFLCISNYDERILQSSTYNPIVFLVVLNIAFLFLYRLQFAMPKFFIDNRQT